jgi:hypothetical protein
MPRQKSVLTGVSSADTVFASGMLTSFGRYEPAAAPAEPEAARLAGISGRVDVPDRRWLAAGSPAPPRPRVLRRGQA